MQAQRLGVQESGNAGAAWDAAMRRGDFDAAWAVSDAILAARDPEERDDAGVPYHERWVWDGRAFEGRRVLVRCYHGLGDTLQFARFLGPLRQRVAHLTLEVQPELLGLLRGVAGPDRLHPFDPAAPLPPSECDLEIMELCHALRLRPEPSPYLQVAATGVRGVGFCWRAGGWDEARSVPAQALRGLAASVDAVSLQRGAAAGALGVADPLEGSMDVEALAGLVAGLDAVVTVDTMVAHLAGALGRPTHLLLKHVPDWRWGVDGVWYRTVLGYRQGAPGDWPGAVAQLTEAIRATIPGREVHSPVTASTLP